MSETIWTTSTSPMIGGITADKAVWDEPPTAFKLRDIVALEAKTRVNAPTFAAKDIETIKEIVKEKLYKQLLQQLMTSGCVKIESVKNPTNQSVTFAARIELVKPKAHDDETRKAA